jgi:predicted phage terminase large subunit-like protein
VTVTNWAEDLARSFEPKPRRYRTPLDLAVRVDRNTRRSAALEVINDALVQLMEPDSPYNALAVYMPPQEGKSQLCSRRFPEWLLDHNPATRIAEVSYGEELALRWGRDIKNDITLNRCRSQEPECTWACGALHVPIRRDSASAGRWETPQGGGVYCVGVGGPLTGKPVDVLVIDDPVKDRGAAESKTIRASTWDWWESVALTRFANSRVVLVQTRWHEDDLAGRIASRPSPLTWRVVRIPAIADAADDPLGRKPGEEMESVRGREPGYFRNLKATMSPYVFSGVYQQSPTAPEGNFFRRQSFRYWRPMEPWADGRARIWLEGEQVTLVDTWRFITMDFAASDSTSADYTVASCWAMTQVGHLVLLDRERAQVPDHEHFAMAERLRAKWAAEMVYAEANWWSKTFVTDARNGGVPVAKVKADRDKVTRAVPAAGRVHAGRVWFPAEVPWLDTWCDELASFPSGAHDDQVDTLSYAALVVTMDWTPARDVPRRGLAPHERAPEEAWSSATGGGDLDIMGVPF